jgi:hypothetical protein
MHVLWCFLLCDSNNLNQDPIKRLPTLGLYLKFGLYRIPVYSVFDSGRFIQDSSLFSVWFRQVYTGFQFMSLLNRKVGPKEVWCRHVLLYIQNHFIIPFSSYICVQTVMDIFNACPIGPSMKWWWWCS